MIQYGSGPQARYAQATSGMAAPPWTQIGTADWPNWKAYLDYLAGKNNITSVTVEYGGPTYSRGMILGPDNKAYSIPATVSSFRFRRYDMATGNYEQEVGQSWSGQDMYWGGVLAHTGNIYLMPYRSPYVMKIDTTTFTSSYIGPVIGDDYRYVGGAVAPNGIIYGSPLNRSGYILKIDPATDTVTEIPGPTGTLKFAGAVTGPDGYVYFTPYSAAVIMRLDPANDSYTLINCETGSGKFLGGAGIGRDGNLYFASYQNGRNRFGKLDIATQTYNTNGGAVTGRYTGFITGPDGALYAVPHSGSTSLARLDATTGTISYLNIGTSGYYSGTIDANGNFMLPTATATASRHGTFNVGGGIDMALAGHFNKH